MNGIHEVTGSIPLSSTSGLPRLFRFPVKSDLGMIGSYPPVSLGASHTKGDVSSISAPSRWLFDIEKLALAAVWVRLVRACVRFSRPESSGR